MMDGWTDAAIAKSFVGDFRFFVFSQSLTYVLSLPILGKTYINTGTKN
jgi:hypothetical protein